LKKLFLIMAAITTFPFAASAQFAAPAQTPAISPMNFNVYVRQRTNVTQWFAATTESEQYAHQDSMLRFSLSQRVHHFDYLLELGQSAELALPADAVSTVTAQGQLGLGGTYYASNNNNQDPAAASFRQGYLRYHFNGGGNTLRLGRFEFFDGQETTPKNSSLLWLQTNRVAQRLVGNFGFSNGQRSFDGLDGKIGGKDWDLTAMVGRATQGVYNMNANPELNVDIQYLAYTRSLSNQHVLVRAFGLGYHDGRTGIAKTDNRTTTARALDHKNIRIGTYGGDMIAAIPAGSTSIDVVIWGAGQSGSWGLLNHSAGAIATEAGLRFDTVPTTPWLRGGYFRSTGDNNNTDGTHNTFFQVLPTPRICARFPYFNQMNSTDSFVQIVDKPSTKIEVRTDLHFLKLTAPTDFWYQGGGAFDNKVFGYTGRPGAAGGSFSSLYDISVDYNISKQLAFNTYYAHSFGKTVVAATYPLERDANYGYFELVYKLQRSTSKSTK
jgi:hypothetical protein